MNTKWFKKFKDKEEKLLDAIYEIQEFLDSTEDEELSSMGAEFCEKIEEFIYDNDHVSLNDIKERIEEY